MGIIVKEPGDRRKQERIPVSFEVYSKNSGNMIGLARDLSSRGLFIETEDEYKPGTKLLLECNLSNSHP
ncbi:MAG TPA: PilZ domain-containing protein, partial [Thermodesulfobacteriota bacterium]|nr:PilZ domain-containing protein [Thermodesulfobacteriota bacterium]